MTDFIETYPPRGTVNAEPVSYAAQHECYRSGQMSEAQWQEHLGSDAALRAWMVRNVPSPVGDTVVTEGSGNVFADLNVTVTLDYVSKRINQICTDHVERSKVLIAQFETEAGALAEAVEASSDIDQNAVALIVLGRVNVMAKELERLAG